METRFGLSVLGVIILALFIGLLAAQTQRKTAAAPAPTAVPTAIPTPGPGEVVIVPVPGTNRATYAPTTLFVARGSTVTWVNKDSSNHTAAASDGSFTSPVLSTGETYTHTFKTVGTFPYSDYLHPELQGEITVIK